MGRNETVNEEMKMARREQILESALELFAVNGLKGVKIADIAKHAKFSQGLVYHYFQSKEDIYTELISVAFHRIKEAISILENLPYEADGKIKIAIEGILENIENNVSSCYFYLLVNNAMLSNIIPENAKTIIEKEHKHPYDVIGKIIRKGQKEGTIQKGNSKDMATLFWTSIKGIAMHKASWNTSFKIPKADLLLRMFLTEKESS